MSTSISDALANLGAVLDNNFATLNAELTQLQSAVANLGTVASVNAGTVTSTGTVSTGGTIANSGTVAAPPPAGTPLTLADYFPADPGNAPYPSPEGTTITATISGTTVTLTATDATGAVFTFPAGTTPYLRAADGSVYVLEPKVAPAGFNSYANLTAEPHAIVRFFDREFMAALKISVAQGQVYFLNGTQWFYITAAGGTGYNSKTLPVLWENGAPLTTDPANPGTVAPSPEYASSFWMDGTLHGAPFLLDKTGAKYEIAPFNPGTITPAGFYGSGILLNGAFRPNMFPAQLTVRQGAVFNEISTQPCWQGATGNTSLPVAYAPGTNQPPMPALPPASPIIGGSSGKTITVGPGLQYTTINQGVSAAAAGDTVLVNPGTYAESIGVQKPVMIQSSVPAVLQGGTINPAPHAVIDVSGIPTASTFRGKGALILEVDGIIVDGFEITGAGLDQTSANMTCGIRVDGGNGWYKIRNCYAHKNQMGFGSSSWNDAVTYAFAIEYDNCIGDNNGIKAGGLTHNWYVGDAVQAIFNNCISTNPFEGHAFKSRAHYSEFNDCVGDSLHESIIDIPQGSGKQVVVNGGSFTKPAASDNHQLFTYAEESQINGTAGMLFTGGTAIDVECPAPFVMVDGGTMTFDGSVKWTGATAKGIAQQNANGGTAVGLD